MAGYYGYSKSNNAIAAEQEERFPLSKAAKVLQQKLKEHDVKWTIPKAKAFLEIHHDGEYHHVSSWYNTVDYYDVSDEWLEMHLDVIKSFEYKPAPKKSERKVLKNQRIKWLEWGGTKKRPKAIEKEATGTVTYVTDKTVLVETDCGQAFRKRLTTNGFHYEAL